MGYCEPVDAEVDVERVVRSAASWFLLWVARSGDCENLGKEAGGLMSPAVGIWGAMNNGKCKSVS